MAIEVSSKYDYIKIKNLRSGGFLLFCERCGGEYEPGLPCPIDIFVAINKSFLESHKECEQEAAEEE